VTDIRIDKDQDLLICTVGLYKLFMAHGRKGHEALSLYLHLMFTARLQETNQVKANQTYLCKGLNIGKVKLKNLKSLLRKLGLIEYVQKRDLDGRINGQYIRVKIWRTEQIDSGGTNIVPQGQKTISPVHHPTGARPQMLKTKRKCLKE